LNNKNSEAEVILPGSYKFSKLYSAFEVIFLVSSKTNCD